MSYESTLKAVRELAERATVRPTPKKLALARKPAGLLPRNVVAFEDLHPPRKVGVGVSAAQTNRAYWPKTAAGENFQGRDGEPCTACGKRRPYCRCTGNRATESDAERFRKSFRVLDPNWASA